MSQGTITESQKTEFVPNDELQGRRFWILVALVGFNSLALVQYSAQLLTWPATAKVMLSSAHVNTKIVSTMADGTTYYSAEVPLKEFPFDVKLKQNRRFDLVTLSAGNLLLLLAFVTTHLRQPMHLAIRAAIAMAAICAAVLLVIGICGIEIAW